MGDIVASLPFLIATCEARGEDCRLTLEPDRPGRAWLGSHPLGGRLLTAEWAGKLAPLLLTVPCVTQVRVGRHEVGCDLSLFRSAGLNLAAGDLRLWYFQTWLGSTWQPCQPWLEVAPTPGFADAVVVNSTGRYRNPAITYHCLQHCERVVFVGLSQEWEAFRTVVPQAAYQEVTDILHLAGVIRGSRCFIGSQSLCWWLAEAMGHPRLLEVYPQAPNCLPLTPNGWDAHKQERWQQIVCQLTN